MNGEKQKFIGGVDFEELRAQRVKAYATFLFDLTTTRSNEEYVITGNYVHAILSTDPDANIIIKFNEIAQSEITFREGRAVRTPFYRLYLSNTAQSGKAITLAFGIESETFEIIDFGKIIDIRETGAAGTPAYAQVSVNTTATVIKAANTKRRSILIQNLDPVNALSIGYDGSVTTGNAGHEIGVNDSLELNTESAIYGIRAAGSGNAAYLEENNA